MSIDSNTIPTLLSVKQLMTFLGVSKATVYRLVDKRQIPTYRIMGSLRFSKDDVLEYLDKNRFESIK